MVAGPLALFDTLQFQPGKDSPSSPTLPLDSQRTASAANEALASYLSSKKLIDEGVLKEASQKWPKATRIVLETSSETHLELPSDLLSRLADLFPKMREIVLRSYSNPYFVFNLSDRDFQTALPKLSQLKAIELHQCRSLSGASFTALFHECKQLVKATIVSDQLDDKTLQAALSNKSLQSLHLSGVAPLTDEALATLSSEGSHLNELSLDFFQQPFTLTAAKAFAASLPQLQRLSFSGCGEMDDAFVLQLRAHHPSLQKLWLDPMPKIAETTFLTIQDIPELKLGQESF